MDLKFKWRQDLKATIKLINQNDKNKKEVKCFEDLKAHIIKSKNIKSIACYMSNSFEININSFIKWALKNNYQIFLPVVNEEVLLFKQVNDLEHLKLNNKFCIYEPVDGNISYKFDLMIIPLLGYSTDNHRLGYGKGYYDKFLSKNSNNTLGIGYKQNLVSKNTFEEHDIKLTNILLF